MRKLILILLFGLVLAPSVSAKNAGCAACHSNDTTVNIGNNELSVALKNHSCDGGVVYSMYMGADADDMLYYSARCKNRSHKYIVQVDLFSSNISTRVLECSIAKTIGIRCFKKLDS